VIRPYRPQDKETLKQITTVCFEHVSIDRNIEARLGLLGGHDWRWRKLRQIEADLADEHASGVLVCEIDDRVVGYVTTRLDPEASIGWIPNLAVMPDESVCGDCHADQFEQFQEGKAGERMVAVVLHHPERKGKFYRVATKEDLQVFQEAAEYLSEKRQKLMEQWGIDPVPDEPLPPVGTLGFRIQRYGMNTWGDLFNARQKLALITFVEKVREAHKRMLEEGYEPEFAKAVGTYLGINTSMLSAFCNTLARWENTSEAIKHLFARQALPMLWDFVETNPFSGSSGSVEAGREYFLKVLEHCSQICNEW
jgi:hypothetical protein